MTLRPEAEREPTTALPEACVQIMSRGNEEGLWEAGMERAWLPLEAGGGALTLFWSSLWVLFTRAGTGDYVMAPVAAVPGLAGRGDSKQPFTYTPADIISAPPSVEAVPWRISLVSQHL